MISGRLHRSAAWLKRLLPDAIWRPIRAVMTGLLTPLRFSLTTGHWQSSIATSARAADGRPIPWYTYPAIDFLAQRDFQNRHVLEFGGGQSTLWWSARARSVFTVEQDAGWLAKLQSQVGGNVSLHHVPVPASTRSLQPVRELLQANPIRAFDIIVVDGHLRQEAAALAFEYLAPGGAIILDNAEGYGFYEEVSKRDCRRVDFFGFAPGVSLRHCTSIVFIEDCFLFQPNIPIPVIDGA
jgi:predicted O-methyltransferase YrrM